QQLRRLGIPIHAIPVRHAFDVRGLRLLRRIVGDLSPQVVHAWGPAAIRAARIIASSDGDGGNVPRLVASSASLPGAGIKGWLTARRLRRCDRVVAATWSEGDRYRRLGVAADRLTRIAPGIAMPEMGTDRALALRELGLPAEAKFIAVAGSLESISGFKAAIWAFDMVRYEHPDWHLVIFGDGPDRVLLEEFGRAIMFDDFRIHFAGSRSDLPQLLVHADLVWITHERGGASLAVEAMAAARPVLGWKSAELAEIIEDGQTGLLVPFGERAMLSAASYPLLDDPDLRRKLGDAGWERAGKHFSATHAIEQFARLYEELAP
ncbi:MAG TPA: glycosyltransferase family 4 protein, partial [Gemmataceae bacterium]